MLSFVGDYRMMGNPAVTTTQESIARPLSNIRAANSHRADKVRG